MWQSGDMTGIICDSNRALSGVQKIPCPCTQLKHNLCFFHPTNPPPLFSDKQKLFTPYTYKLWGFFIIRKVYYWPPLGQNMRAEELSTQAFVFSLFSATQSIANIRMTLMNICFLKEWTFQHPYHLISPTPNCLQLQLSSAHLPQGSITSKV